MSDSIARLNEGSALEWGAITVLNECRVVIIKMNSFLGEPVLVMLCFNISFPEAILGTLHALHKVKIPQICQIPFEIFRDYGSVKRQRWRSHTAVGE